MCRRQGMQPRPAPNFFMPSCEDAWGVACLSHGAYTCKPWQAGRLAGCMRAKSHNVSYHHERLCHIHPMHGGWARSAPCSATTRSGPACPPGSSSSRPAAAGDALNPHRPRTDRLYTYCTFAWDDDAPMPRCNKRCLLKATNKSQPPCQPPTEHTLRRTQARRGASMPPCHVLPRADPQREWATNVSGPALAVAAP